MDSTAIIDPVFRSDPKLALNPNSERKRGRSPSVGEVARITTTEPEAFAKRRCEGRRGCEDRFGHEVDFAYCENLGKHLFAICVATGLCNLSQNAKMTDWYAREWRKKIGRTLESVAAELGTSVGYLSDMEKGKRRYNSDWTAKIAAAYGLSPSDMFRDPNGNAPTTRTVAVVGFVGAGSIATLFSEGQGPFDEVEAPSDATQFTVGLNIDGASLGPAFDKGIVFYDDVRSPVTPDLHGRLCVVGLQGGRVLVKLLKSAGDGTFHLISNTVEEPMWNQAVEWAARVKDVRPR